MAARLISFAVLIATMTACSMAMECNHSPPGTNRKLPCASGWCKKEHSLSSSSILIRYECDTEKLCTILGDGCHDGQDDEEGNFGGKVVSEPDEEGREHDGRYKVCCCNTNLCNSATFHTQHLLLGAFSIIMSMIMLA
uniref:Activin types I and II receptor domain-containing protein n=1 Tax=Plectus sambesii TaxID=2011161 RepID=A0A914VWY2_9BILA